MKWRSLAATLAASTVIAFAGAVSGTLAWYAYATRASVSYEGTSVYNTKYLQIGLKLDWTYQLDDINRYNDPVSKDGFESYTPKEEESDFAEILKYEDNNNTYAYWFVKPGADLKSGIINKYLMLTNNDKAGNLLKPVTTREFDGKNDFHLYRAPAAHEYDLGDANKDAYKTIEFGFRVVRTDTGDHIKAQDIWLSDVKADLSGTDVDNGLRIYMEGKRLKGVDGSGHKTFEDEKILFNPTAEYDGNTKVAGLLDLNGDGYYDFVDENYSGNGKEILYGVDNTYGTHTFTDADYTSKRAWEYNNINSYENVSQSTDMNTFYAAHKIGNTGFENYNDVNLPSANYFGRETIYPKDNSGKLSEGVVLTSTSDDNSAIADLKVTIYLEGWDHSIIDSNAAHRFELGLVFQVNKVE